MSLYTYVYLIFLLLSMSAVVAVAVFNYKNIEIYYWSISLILPMVLTGYFMRSIATTADGAIIGNNIGYIGGTLMAATIQLCMIKEMKITIRWWYKTLIYIAGIIIMAFIWIGSFNGWFYKSVEVVATNKGNAFKVVAGPYNYVYTIYVAVLFFSVLGAYIYAIVKKRKFSYRVLGPYMFLMIGTAVVYFYEKFFGADFEWITVLYMLTEIYISFSYDKNYIHDIDAIVANLHSEDTNKAYVIMDMNKCFLGANERAYKIIPELKDYKIDKPIISGTVFDDTVDSIIANFESGDKKPKFYPINDRVYKYTLSYFYIRKADTTAGFLLEIEDDTEQQKRLEYVSKYNESLHLERDAQIEHIKEIQEKVLLGVANMIENRDNNTGGHVRRTSDVIQILVDTMLENHIANLDRKMAEAIVKAAPMHDLGKIAIDNSILLKPGKLTPEEYNEMKRHSTKSGEIVISILQGVESPEFVNVAFNVARYHHEKFDGSGYPEGRKGNEIPLEARIMAIADVYDALVSKRCYKEAMSFEKAYSVMLDSMGSHFDPMLEEAFVKSRTQLENYYRLNSM